MRTIKRARDVRWLFQELADEIWHPGTRLVLLIGYPGSGKVMLSRRLAARLPAPSMDTQEEQAWIWTGSGLGVPRTALPFRAPHHTCSSAAIVGGGPLSRQRPGEVSLAHGGTLLLDDIHEYRRPVLDALWSVLARGKSQLHMPGGQDGWYEIPAMPQLVIGTIPPCPCGWHGFERHRACDCSSALRRSFDARVAPLMERFHLVARTDLDLPVLKSPTMRRLLAPPPLQSGAPA
jgi:magnesium chelatase family protein